MIFDIVKKQVVRHVARTRGWGIVRNIILLSVLLLMASTNTAKATDGVYLGFGLLQNTLTSNDFSPLVSSAYGPNFLIGYKFGKLGVEGDFITSKHHGKAGYSNADLFGYSLNLVYPFWSNVNNRGNLVQYCLLGGYGYYEIDVSNGNNLRGNGYNFGLSQNYYFTEKVAQVMRIVYRMIEYDKTNNAAIPTPVRGNTITVELGITHQF